jgi:hypothetical protein
MLNNQKIFFIGKSLKIEKQDKLKDEYLSSIRNILDIDKSIRIFKTNSKDEFPIISEKYTFFDGDQILKDNDKIQIVNQIYNFNQLNDYKITYYKWDLINVDEKIDNILFLK